MAFDPDRLLALPPRETISRHGPRDVMLYALGVGSSIEDPLAPETLKFCYERGLSVLPTMAVVLAWPGFWASEPSYGIDWKRLLHGEQSLILHKPIPVEGELVSQLRITDIYDKGAAKGALLYSQRDLYERSSGDLLATEIRGTFLRGNGGAGGRTDAAPAPYQTTRTGDPDIVVSLPTRTDQALLYRLSGDYNPLHADPAIAAGAGFEAPILHGLCTYGVVGRAVLGALCANDPARLKRLDCRFSSPVFPGETIVTEFWVERPGVAAFRASVQERGVVVLTNGLAEYR